MKLILALIFLITTIVVHASSEPVWYTHNGKQVAIHVDLFLASTCPHCQKADIFFREIEKKTPWLYVHRYMISEDKFALQTFYKRLQHQHSTNFSVPGIFFCDSLWTGFASANTSGKLLMHALTYCKQKISQQGELRPATINVLQRWGSASQFRIHPTISRSVFTLIPYAALMDAVSPCSLFCLAAFLAFLWLYPARNNVNVVGGTVLVSLGVTHYVQQAHSAFYYQMIPKLKIPAVLVGFLLFFAVLHHYRNRTSRVISKPELLTFAVIIVTVSAVQIYQQTCVFNMGLILEQWFAEQALSPTTHVIYDIIYQVFYLLPLMLLLQCYRVFGCHPRMVRYQTLLTILAYLILASIGVILIVRAQLLASFSLSLIVLIASMIVAWFLAKHDVLKWSSR